MVYHNRILGLLQMVKKEMRDILVAEQGEVKCLYCALLHVEGTHDSSPTPFDGLPPILNYLHDS